MGTVRRLLEARAEAGYALTLRYPNPYPPRLRKWPVAVAAGKLRLVVGTGRRGAVPRVVGVRRMRRPAEVA